MMWTRCLVFMTIGTFCRVRVHHLIHAEFFSYWISSSTTDLIRNSESHDLHYRLDWLAGIVVNNGLDLNKKFKSSFLIRTMIMSLTSFVITVELIQFFLNPQYPGTVKISSWIFHCECEVGQHAVSKFLEDRIGSCYCFTINESWNKESACTKLII